MAIAGFTSVQASNESNLTRALRSASLSATTDVEELSCNPVFLVIETGDAADAGVMTADLVKSGRLSTEQMDHVLRSMQSSPNQAAFVEAYNLRARMDSPHYQRFQAALQNDAYSDAEKKEVKKMFKAYMNGEKLTSLRIPSPKNK